MSSSVLSQSATSNPQLYASSLSVGAGGISTLGSPNMCLKGGLTSLGNVPALGNGIAEVLDPLVTVNSVVLGQLMGAFNPGLTTITCDVTAGVGFQFIANAGSLGREISYLIVKY